jgi:membrane protein implicated in regulation of membrane protease activity
MSLEFLSGLLLVSAVLAIVGYIVKELFPRDRVGELSKSMQGALKRQREREAKPVNEHLVGMTGEVIANTEDDDRPMKVRLGIELWPARADSPEESRFPVGTSVEVSAVDEPLVIVRRNDAPDETGGSEGD